METLPLVISFVLICMALLLILYPIWKQTRPEAILSVDRSGQTLEEYQARYQAALAAIKDLMFDYEMGKVSAEDHQALLYKVKLEAAKLREQIDLLSHDTETESPLDAEIEERLAQLRGSKLKEQEAAVLTEVDAEIELLKQTELLAEVDAEIELLKQAQTNNLTCPNCNKSCQPDALFCSGCGQPLPKTQENGCPECGHAVQPGDAFCSNCGQPLPQLQENICPECGHAPQPDDLFCPKCGTTLKEIETLRQAG
jgi:DNA-directed RNA polymerase subunit RPC12/RpoP